MPGCDVGAYNFWGVLRRVITVADENRALHPHRCKAARACTFAGSAVESSFKPTQDEWREHFRRNPVPDLWRHRMAQHHARQRARSGALRVPAEKPQRAIAGGGEDSSAV